MCEGSSTCIFLKYIVILQFLFLYVGFSPKVLFNKESMGLRCYKN